MDWRITGLAGDLGKVDREIVEVGVGQGMADSGDKVGFETHQTDFVELG